MNPIIFSLVICACLCSARDGVSPRQGLSYIAVSETNGLLWQETLNNVNDANDRFGAEVDAQYELGRALVRKMLIVLHFAPEHINPTATSALLLKLASHHGKNAQEYLYAVLISNSSDQEIVWEREMPLVGYIGYYRSHPIEAQQLARDVWMALKNNGGFVKITAEDFDMLEAGIVGEGMQILFDKSHKNIAASITGIFPAFDKSGGPILIPIDEIHYSKFVELLYKSWLIYCSDTPGAPAISNASRAYGKKVFGLYAYNTTGLAASDVMRKKLGVSVGEWLKYRECFFKVKNR